MDEAAFVPSTGFYARLERLRSDMLAAGEQQAVLSSAPSNWRRPTRLVALAAAVPGFAALWRQTVPDEALERVGNRVTVSCRCGARVVVAVGAVAFCTEECGRWFLGTEEDVRVKVWPRQVAA